MQRTLRLKRELEILSQQPPYGITCWQDDENGSTLKANITGSEGTAYAGGVFKLKITITNRYPFEPPKVLFLTPIYHPNIDAEGRICLDTLKMPPHGAWKPSLNISSVLTTIQLLMSEPNPDNPLMPDIASEYKYDKSLFLKKAKECTKKHAQFYPNNNAHILKSEHIDENDSSVASSSTLKRSAEDAKSNYMPSKKLFV